jgi:hypothetical protein
MVWRFEKRSSSIKVLNIVVGPVLFDFDFFVFGHRHLPIDFQLNEHSRYINLGDWIKYNSYAEFDGSELLLKYH